MIVTRIARRSLAAGLGVAALAALSLPGCTPVGAVVGAGATAGVAAAEERGIGGVAEDVKIKGLILDRYVRADHRLVGLVGATVYGREVLLTGTLPDAGLRDAAVRLAWQVEDVTRVINELRVDPDGSGVKDFANDTWIATRLKARLTFDSEILAINYQIAAHDGTVYLMGTAQSRQELDRVVAHARDLAYVNRVITLARVKEAPAPTRTATAGGGRS